MNILNFSIYGYNHISDILKESLLYPPVLYVLIIAYFYTVSLSKIGNLTKAFKAYKTNPLDATGLTTALGSFGDLNIAAKYLKQVNSDGYLTENIAGSFLHNAYRTHAVADATAAYANVTASSGGLGSLFGGAGLMAGTKSAGSGLMTVLRSIAPTLMGLLGVGIAFKAGKTVWDNILTDSGAKKRYQTCLIR